MRFDTNPDNGVTNKTIEHFLSHDYADLGHTKTNRIAPPL